ncbi:MAG TPA: prephenate dehydrogenase/arogenate dehydrogenase family protein [Candidatus Acidoferrales bacterium]|nr:prephenate dehydrogenase/arogenate dehydrogenase family protein [Candidatus Acidoferrales bacterium]
MPQLGVIGTGLIGASIALAAQNRGWEVLGFDRDPAAVSTALVSDAIDRVAERDEIYARCSIVVIAAHVSGTLDEVLELRRRVLRGDQLVVDVASVKEPIAFAGAAVAAFVPTHPMAGGERRGPGAARADLFQGRTWCYVPTADDLRTERAKAFIQEMGATPLAVDAHEHDEIVALTSHLPQLLAYVFTQCVNERAGVDPALVDALCGPAARELLRLGRSSPQMWDEIFSANHDALRHELTRFLEAIDDRRIPG